MISTYQKHVVGIDIAERTVQSCLLRAGDAVDAKGRSRNWPNTPEGFQRFLTFLRQQGIPAEQTVVCMENTGGFEEALADTLHDSGYTVVVVNPYRVKRWAESELKRGKNDIADAHTLAQFVRTAAKLHPWRPASPVFRELRQLTRMREALVETITAWSNRRGMPLANEATRTCCDQVLADLCRQRKAVEVQIATLLKNSEELRALAKVARSVPSLGTVTVPVLLGELGDCHQFQNYRQATAQVGLSIVDCTSADTRYCRPHISKQGNARVRKALYWPAITALRCDPTIKTFAERLAANKLNKMQIIVAVMRKLLIRYYTLVRTGQVYDPAYQSSWGRQA